MAGVCFSGAEVAEMAEGLEGLFTFIGAMESVPAGDAMVPEGKRNEERDHDG
jgi:hypothetical protein